MKYQVRVCLGKTSQIVEKMDGTKATVKPPECGYVFNLIAGGGTLCPHCSAPTKLVEEYEADSPRDLSKPMEKPAEKPKSTSIASPPNDRAMSSPPPSVPKAGKKGGRRGKKSASR